MFLPLLVLRRLVEFPLPFPTDPDFLAEFATFAFLFGNAFLRFRLLPVRLLLICREDSGKAKTFGPPPSSSSPNKADSDGELYFLCQRRIQNFR